MRTLLSLALLLTCSLAHAGGAGAMFNGWSSYSSSSGGGGTSSSTTGYATVVVSSPSGNATTDTANINAAFTTVSNAGGGSVVMREGTYLLNAELDPPANLNWYGQGMTATVIQAQNGLTGTHQAMVYTSHGNMRIADMTFDCNYSARGSHSGYDFFMVDADKKIVERVLFEHPTALGNAQFGIFSFPHDYSSIVRDSWFVLDGAVGNIGINTPNGGMFGSHVEVDVNYTQTAILVDEEGRFENNGINVTVSQSNPVVLMGIGTNLEVNTVIGNTFIGAGLTGNVAIKAQDAGNSTWTNAAVVGNVSLNGGSIVIISANKVTVSSNLGFSSYTGGFQSGNDQASTVFSSTKNFTGLTTTETDFHTGITTVTVTCPFACNVQVCFSGFVGNLTTGYLSTYYLIDGLFVNPDDPHSGYLEQIGTSGEHRNLSWCEETPSLTAASHKFILVGRVHSGGTYDMNNADSAVHNYFSAKVLP